MHPPAHSQPHYPPYTYSCYTHFPWSCRLRSTMLVVSSRTFSSTPLFLHLLCMNVPKKPKKPKKNDTHAHMHTYKVLPAILILLFCLSPSNVCILCIVHFFRCLDLSFIYQVSLSPLTVTDFFDHFLISLSHPDHPLILILAKSHQESNNTKQ